MGESYNYVQVSISPWEKYLYHSFPRLTELINTHPHPQSLVQPSCILKGHFKLEDVK